MLLLGGDSKTHWGSSGKAQEYKLVGTLFIDSGDIYCFFFVFLGGGGVGKSSRY